MNKLFNPKVSIIIPAYNASKYLKESIDSALAQTYKNIEIIVVNDGSTDNGKTDKIAKSYGNKIKYYNKENGGVSTALNFAISKMTGEYFSWLSHDDRYYPEKIENQINYLKENNLEKNNIILYSDYDLMNTHSKVYANSIKNHKELTEKPEYALIRGEINGITLLIPKKAFDECGVFDENLRCTQDYELWKKMQRKYAFIHQEGILATTRTHKEQQGNTNPKMLTEGEPFWTNLLLNEISLETKIKLSNSEYAFYNEMVNFFLGTPYKKTVLALKEKINSMILDINKIIQDIKVSVIIPFYNRTTVLVNAINSVLEQSHQNFELILIDDGSTDDLSSTIKIINNDKRIKYIKEENNKGVSHARNLGIEQATGEYVCFLDSDDLFVKNKIEIQLREMLLTQSEFSHTSYIRRIQGKKIKMETGLLDGSPIPRMIAGCGIATPTIMIKKDFLINNNFRYNESLEIGEDVCFYLEMFKNIKILGINEFLSIVNVNNESASINTKKQLKGLQTIINYIINNKQYSQYHYEISLLFNQYLDLTNTLYKDENIILPDCINCKRIKNSTSWKITKPIRIIGYYKSYLNREHWNNLKYEIKSYGMRSTIKKILNKIFRRK